MPPHENGVATDDPHLTDLVLRSIVVEGFRGASKPIRIDLKRDANFLIGQNGTGKTTFINIVSDCLMCRYQSLMNSPFDRAEIHFRHADNRHKPYLIVEKDYDDFGEIESLSFSFWDFKTKRTPTFSYQIKSRIYRRGDDVSGAVAQRRILYELNRRFKLTWLSINRASGLGQKMPEAVSDLNAKLDNTLQRLSTYFTRLDSQFASEMQKFQQEWFMSLLVSQKREALNLTATDFDADNEGSQIREMLSGIGIQESHFSAKVDRHVKAIRRVTTEDPRESSVDVFNHIADTYDISKLHFLVGQWADLQEVKKEIYATKTRLVDVANQMLFRKSIRVDSGNRISIARSPDTSSGKLSPAELRRFRRDQISGKVNQLGEVSYEDLSSGEKQLLIFLGETALRSGSSYVFIADEPELSLHIDWQERLVPAIMTLSPSAQVFFATHSPDIVSTYGDNVFSMEEFLS